MKLGNILNLDRTRALPTDNNAYVQHGKFVSGENIAKVQSADKVIFPEAYENASGYYNKNQFSPPPRLEHNTPKPQPVQHPMFDIKSLLPMLLGGKFNDLVNPLMSMLGGKSGGMDIAKIFELFKPKTSVKKEKKSIKEEEDMSSKFDDMIIIED